MILIFGAKGQLGTAFQELFDRKDIKYIATDKEQVDITNAGIVREYIREIHKAYGVNLIINCAAYNDVDRAEEDKDNCYKLNMEAPVNLAMIAMEIGANYVTYSTDFVFGGRIEKYLYDDNVGFVEEDETRPLSTYAESKYEGEILIQNQLENYSGNSKIYIVRTSWVFGKGNTNFVEKIIDWSQNNEELRVVDDQISSPTYAKDLALYSWKLLEKSAPSGLYHFTNEGTVSKYEQAKYILEKINWNGNLISVKSDAFETLAKRPKFSKLNCKKIKEVLGEGIPHWKEGIDNYLREIGKI